MIYEKQITSISQIAEGKCDKLVITGSVALSEYGFVNPQTVHDIDLAVINPNQYLLDFLTFLQKAYPVKNSNSNYNYGSLNCIRFHHMGLDIDVFPYWVNIPTFEKNGFHFASPKHILKAKADLKRSKDYRHAHTIVTNILNMFN